MCVVLAASSLAHAWQCALQSIAQKRLLLSHRIINVNCLSSSLHCFASPVGQRSGGPSLASISIRLATGTVKAVNRDDASEQSQDEQKWGGKNKGFSTDAPSPHNTIANSSTGSVEINKRRRVVMKPTNLRGRSRLQHTLRKNTRRIDVGSSKQLEDLLEQGVSVYQMDIRGSSLPGRQDAKGRLISQTNALPAPELLQHPVLTALQERRRTRSKPGARQDGYKIALAVEGGGLRGSVSAGMASALAHLGAEDAFDMVLGSSAGSIIGAYFVARASPNTTYDFFCNHLTTSQQARPRYFLL